MPSAPGLCSWEQARREAYRCVGALPPCEAPLREAAGAVLAADTVALTDLPAVDTAALDGWAVAGPPPWRVGGEVRAGTVPGPLRAGEAIVIATGAVVPPGVAGVLRAEWGHRDGDLLHVAAAGSPDALVRAARDIRRAGSECRAGEVTLPAGSRLTPVAVGLLAACGLDAVPVRRARAAVLVLGDELLDAGPARDGLLRDALGPLLASWLPAVGLRLVATTRVADERAALADALATCGGDVVVTTGSTARGPVDHLHDVLAGAGARLVVDGVAVRPGHPQVLARLADGRVLVGLPGNPLAAVSGLLTLLEPVVAAMHGLPEPRPGEVRLKAEVSAGAQATRLVPVRDGRPVLFAGPAMLRGLATADAVAVVPPGGARAGDVVSALSLPGMP